MSTYQERLEQARMADSAEAEAEVARLGLEVASIDVRTEAALLRRQNAKLKKALDRLHGSRHAKAYTHYLHRHDYLKLRSIIEAEDDPS